LMLARQVGAETLLSHIIEMVRQAQGSKAPVQKTVDKIAGIFVPVVIAIALTSFVLWAIFGGEHALTHALMAMVTVLVIACPCALGLATPTAVMVGMGKGAENGILIKDAESLEILHKVNAVVLDKTGTITEGKPVVTDTIWLVDPQEQLFLKSILLALENKSSHPLAEAVAESIKNEDNVRIEPETFENLPGKGIVATFRNSRYLAGNIKLMSDFGVAIPDLPMQRISEFQHEARTVICFARDDKVIALIALADKLKDTSSRAIQMLTDAGIEVFMLTGDNLQTARAVASQVGILHYKANMLPADKAGYVRQLQTEGKVVAMVGDGINDSHALAEADISIAMGKGSDIAMDVSGMTIISSDLQKIAKAVQLSRLTVSTIRQNLFWAFIYNVIGIPVAAGALYPWGFMLNPMIAAAAMAMSSVSVVSNSLRLRTKKL